MTLLTDPAARDEVGVHALLIGVGRYPHLFEGRSPRKFELCGDMGQLSSPSHSVKAFQEWLQSGIQLAGAPLRSLRVLRSSPQRGRDEGVASPTIDNIRSAAQEWLEDCGKHEDNVALFYFCGHGIDYGDATALLAQDFGKDNNYPFGQSFDPSVLVDAALAYKASRQLFLIDACRSTPPAIKAAYPRITPALLIQPRTHGNKGKTKQSELRAADVAAAAYGVPERPSLFMNALLACMTGAGALQDDDGNWAIGTASLRAGIDWLVKRDHKGIQRVVFGELSSEFHLHQVVGTPVVPVNVRVEPMYKLAQLQLSTDCGKSRPDPVPTAWKIDVDMGDRVFFAGDAAHPRMHSHAERIHPPYRVVSIPCGDNP